MSITTKRGDDGSTALLFGRRVPKTHPRVEAYGAVDELSACLGLVRAGLSTDSSGAELIRTIQADLISLMAETAVDAADLDRWLDREPKRISEDDVARLEAEITRREQALPPLRAFDLPGENEIHARAHLARTVCRRAERGLVGLVLSHGLSLSPELPRYLNRLSDLLWLIGRSSLSIPVSETSAAES